MKPRGLNGPVSRINGDSSGKNAGDKIRVRMRSVREEMSSGKHSMQRTYGKNRKLINEQGGGVRPTGTD